MNHSNIEREPLIGDRPGTCRVSVIIKTLNEEKNIVMSVESALAAVAPFGGEVIVADSCSSDRTIEWASNYPVRIVQLADPNERCCGIGPQLGYQHSRGEYVYILDGDMKLLEAFMGQAIKFLDSHADYAGVGGKVIEANTQSLEYAARDARASSHMREGQVDRLEMGGLYRRSAIGESGYFSDRNLHSYEELDLAVRLRARGWKLWRIANDAVVHHGHESPAFALLKRRWRTGYICGLGELVRVSWGRPQMGLVLEGAAELKVYASTVVWMAAIVLICVWPFDMAHKLAVLACLVVLPVLVMMVRKKSAAKAVFSLVSWCFNAAGLLRGLFNPRKPPALPISSRLIRDFE